MDTLIQVFKFIGLALAIGFGVYYISLFAGAGFTAGVFKSIRRFKNGEGKEQKSDVQKGSGTGS